MEIGVDVQLGVDDFVKGQLAFSRVVRKNAVVRLGVVLIVAGALIAVTGGWSAGLPLVALGVLYATAVIPRYSLRSLYGKDPTIQERVAWRFGPAGYSTAMVGSETRAAWMRVRHVIVTRDVLVLSIGRGAMHIIPRRCFQPGALEQVLQWCAAGGGPITPTVA